jgi:hypothetical protein
VSVVAAFQIANEFPAMTPTPRIPSWIRSYRTRAYTNIYAMCPGERRLFGTESLYGDWSADLLLLAKDFGTSDLVRGRIRAGETRPFRHTDWRREPQGTLGAKTNRTLYRLAERIPCRKLYGSALAGLLRDDGRGSGTLAGRREIEPFVGRVLRFTLDHLPNLRAIACLGQDAWDFTLAGLGLGPEDWRARRASRQPVTFRGVKLFALAHPRGMPGGGETVIGDWDALARGLRG